MYSERPDLIGTYIRDVREDTYGDVGKVVSERTYKNPDRYYLVVEWLVSGNTSRHKEDKFGTYSTDYFGSDFEFLTKEEVYAEVLW